MQDIAIERCLWFIEAKFRITEFTGLLYIYTLEWLDYSKAFDTLRHSTLLYKMASMNIPDEVYSTIGSSISSPVTVTVQRSMVPHPDSLTSQPA